MSLPTEIRLNVLRNLLRSSTDLEFHNFDRENFYGHDEPRKLCNVAREKYLKQLHLSSQVLRCCKLLLAEGRPNLYSENRFCVALRIEQHGFWESYMTNDTLVRYGAIRQKKYSSASNDTVITKFSKLRLVFYVSNEAAATAICHHIKNVCLGKDVVIDFANRSHLPTTILRAITSLDCQTLSFEGVEELLTADQYRLARFKLFVEQGGVPSAASMVIRVCSMLETFISSTEMTI